MDATGPSVVFTPFSRPSSRHLPWLSQVLLREKESEIASCRARAGSSVDLSVVPASQQFDEQTFEASLEVLGPESKEATQDSTPLSLGEVFDDTGRTLYCRSMQSIHGFPRPSNDESSKGQLPLGASPVTPPGALPTGISPSDVETYDQSAGLLAPIIAHGEHHSPL